MNARDAARWLADEFELAGIEEAKFEAEVLVRWAAGIDRAQFFAGHEIDCGRLPLVGMALRRRLAREPLSYITGHREFYGREFMVSPAVLIPRPESELLVELALAELHRSGPGLVADAGTGSGCIAISVALDAPHAEVVAIDLSVDALAIASANARALGARVAFVRGSLASMLRRADILVANLPYIPARDIAAIEPEVRDWEPRLALDGGPDGLDLVRELLAQAAVLEPRLLALEVGFNQGRAVAAMVERTGARADVYRDLAGIERVVCGRWR